MKWDPICKCGNHKKLGRTECKACRKAQKALRKGNLRRYDRITMTNPAIGEVYEGKPYKRIGDLLIEIAM